MNMTGAELRTVLTREFAAKGLSPYLWEEKSQFLDFPEELFAEVVLRDGTKLGEAKEIAQKVKTELRREGQTLDTIVRAVWEVEDVGSPATAYSMETGGPRAAVTYPVTIRSGKAQRKVWVEVTYLASKTFEEKGVSPGGEKDIVRNFVAEQLRMGGASYWDPERSPSLEINADTAEYIASRVSRPQ